LEIGVFDDFYFCIFIANDDVANSTVEFVSFDNTPFIKLCDAFGSSFFLDVSISSDEDYYCDEKTDDEYCNFSHFHSYF
jgi:hypothetical protein